MFRSSAVHRCDHFAPSRPNVMRINGEATEILCNSVF